MKKIILFATMAVAATLASCSKNTEIEAPEIIDPDGPQVRLTLGSEDAATRAFFDNSATAESWENELKTLAVYAFDASGKFVIKRSMTASELMAKTVTFVLPNSATGRDYSFYAVANTDYGHVLNATEMERIMESVTLDEYNGTFAQTGQGRKRTAGFVMTGMATAKIAGSTTTVAITLKRTVAKIALRVRMDASFATAYGNGTVTINSVKLSRATSSSYSFYKAGNYGPRSSLYETTQTPQTSDGYTNGMFYIYGNNTLATGSRVLLTLTGVFDGDGNSSTTTDRMDVEYKIELAGIGTGEILRNGYYRVDASIKGLSGDGAGAITANITVASWETPVTQTITLGN